MPSLIKENISLGPPGKSASAKLAPYDGSNGISALKLHLMGTTKRSFYTRKEVLDFLNKTEQ
jgi:hypothetical protein